MHLFEKVEIVDATLRQREPDDSDIHGGLWATIALALNSVAVKSVADSIICESEANAFEPLKKARDAASFQLTACRPRFVRGSRR